MRLAALLERNVSLHFRHFRSPGSWGKGRVDIACGSFSEEVEEGWVTGSESNRVDGLDLEVAFAIAGHQIVLV